jgi:hypothetical protein
MGAVPVETCQGVVDGTAKRFSYARMTNVHQIMNTVVRSRASDPPVCSRVLMAASCQASAPCVAPSSCPALEQVLPRKADLCHCTLAGGDALPHQDHRA